MKDEPATTPPADSPLARFVALDHRLGALTSDSELAAYYYFNGALRYYFSSETAPTLENLLEAFGRAVAAGERIDHHASWSKSAAETLSDPQDFP